MKQSAALLILLLAACSSGPPGGRVGIDRFGGAPGTEQELVQDVGDRVYFDFNRSALRGGENLTTLTRQSLWMKHYPDINVQIAGNCDERGTEDYNLALGQRRADAA